MKKGEKRVVLTKHAYETLLNCRVMYEAIFGRKMNGPEATEAAANALQQWLERMVRQHQGLLDMTKQEEPSLDFPEIRTIWFLQLGAFGRPMSKQFRCRELEAGEYRPPFVQDFLEKEKATDSILGQFGHVGIVDDE